MLFCGLHMCGPSSRCSNEVISCGAHVCTQCDQVSPRSDNDEHKHQVAKVITGSVWISWSSKNVSSDRFSSQKKSTLTCAWFSWTVTCCSFILSTVVHQEQGHMSLDVAALENKTGWVILDVFEGYLCSKVGLELGVWLRIMIVTHNPLWPHRTNAIKDKKLSWCQVQAFLSRLCIQSAITV